MAKKDSVTLLPVGEITPATGGSYIRNAETGEMELQHCTTDVADDEADNQIDVNA